MELVKEEVPVKMFICDVWKLKQHETETNYFFFKDRYIRKVDVMGIVTEVRKIGDNHFYRVDDGTGTITCCFNHSNERNMSDFREIEALQEAVGDLNYYNFSEEKQAMELLLEEAFNANRISIRPLDQGDCVHLQGFVRNFHDKRELTAFRLYRVHSSVDEVDRVFELSHLYTKCYSRDASAK